MQSDFEMGCLISMLKSKKILFIVDELPFPPRNGVTIPSYNLIKGLREEFTIALLWIRNEKDGMSNEILDNNNSIVDHFFVLDMAKDCFFAALCKEFFLIKSSFSGVKGVFAEGDRFELSEFDPDIIFCSPIRSIANLKYVKDVLRDRNRLVVAAINDSYTATLWMRCKQVFGSRWPLIHRIKSIIYWLRSFWMLFLEKKILNDADVILVQTCADKEWICKISKSQFCNKTYVLSNGVDEKILEAPKIDYSRSFGYAGPLKNPCHKVNVQFLVEKILPKIHNKYSDVKFFVLGKSDCSGLSDWLEMNSGVVYKEYVDDMFDFYTRTPILFVRNFKNIGIINRTIESMAAGVVVIGEEGAFNGIQGFQDGVHGFIANDEDQILRYLFLLFGSPEKWHEISCNAKKLIKDNFQWKDRLEYVHDILISKSN